MQRTEWILFLTVLLAVAGFALPTPVITPMFMAPGGGLLAADAGQTERVWWLMGCFALYPLGQMLGSPWLGRLSDRFGRRPVLSAALMGVVFSYVLMAVAIWWQWLWLLLAARLLSGLCNGTVAIAQALAADISAPARKPVLFSRLNIALNMGWIIGPLAGGLLAEQTGDYAMPFLIAGVVALLNLAGVRWGLPEQPCSRVVEAAQVKAVSLWQVPQIRLYLVLTLLSYGAIMLYFNFFNVWLVERFGQTPFELALAAVIVSVPMSVGSWLAGRLSGRLDLLWLGLAGHLLMALGMGLFIVPPSLLGLYLVMTVAGVGITVGEQATALGVSNNAPAEQQGEAMGLYRGLAMGSELSAAVVGVVLILPGLEFAYIGAALLALSCAVIFLQQAVVRLGWRLMPG